MRAHAAERGVLEQWTSSARMPAVSQPDPAAERARLSLVNDLRRVFRQRNISTRNIAWAESLANHDDERVRTLATIVAEVGRVHPHRRRPTAVLRHHRGELWQRMIAAGVAEDWCTFVD